jgi:DNA-binding transcriptional LysR family regulator
MPYGIQGPAISKQMIAFEEDLGGHKLFERSPFRLTAVGERVATRATQLIEGVCALVNDLKHGKGVRLRVTSWEWVLQNQVSDVVTFLRRRDVNATFSLPPSRQTQMESWLCDDMIDIAIGALSERMPYGVESEPLLQLPLVLLVPRGKAHAHIKSADYFWRQQPIKEPLVCPPPTEVVGRNFLEELERRSVDWPVTLEAGSAAAVTRYVADGHGIGVSLNFPDLVRDPRIRVLPLVGFPPVTIGVMWRKADGRPDVVLEILFRIVRQFWPELAVPTVNRHNGNGEVTGRSGEIGG